MSSDSEEEEDEEEEENEESEEESDSSSSEPVEWRYLPRTGVRAGTRRTIKRKLSVSTGDDDFYGQQRWQEDASDLTYATSSGAQREALLESVCSSWTSGDESNMQSSTSTKPNKKKPAQRRKLPKPEALPLRPSLGSHHQTVELTQQFSQLGIDVGQPISPWYDRQVPLINKIKPSSLAHKAGIRSGMTITHVNGTQVMWLDSVIEITNKLDKDVSYTLGLQSIEKDTDSESYSDSEQDDDDEESEESSQEGDGIGKGKGPPPVVVESRKPAAKNTKGGRVTSFKESLAWQNNRLKQAKVVAADTHDTLAEIVDKMKRVEEQRAEQFRLIKEGRRLTGPRIVYHSSLKKSDGKQFVSCAGTQRQLLVFPKQVPNNITGVDDNLIITKRTSWKYSDPITGLGFNSVSTFKSIRTATHLATTFLAKHIYDHHIDSSDSSSESTSSSSATVTDRSPVARPQRPPGIELEPQYYAMLSKFTQHAVSFMSRKAAKRVKEPSKRKR